MHSFENITKFTETQDKNWCKTHHGDHWGDGEGQGLRHPVGGHQDDEVGTLHGLQQLEEMSAKLGVRIQAPPWDRPHWGRLWGWEGRGRGGPPMSARTQRWTHGAAGLEWGSGQGVNHLPPRPPVGSLWTGRCWWAAPAATASWMGLEILFFYLIRCHGEITTVNPFNYLITRKLCLET